MMGWSQFGSKLWFKQSRPLITHCGLEWHHSTRSTWAEVRACRLFGAGTLTKPMLTYCPLCLRDNFQLSVKYELNMYLKLSCAKLWPFCSSLNLLLTKRAAIRGRKNYKQLQIFVDFMSLSDTLSMLLDCFTLWWQFLKGGCQNCQPQAQPTRAVHRK